MGLEILVIFVLVRFDHGFPVYLGCLSVAVEIPCAAQIELRNSIEVYKNTAEAIRSWRMPMVVFLKGIYYHKLLYSLMPCLVLWSYEYMINQLMSLR